MPGLERMSVAVRQHGDAARDVEPADANRQAGREEVAARDRRSAGNWLDLHADQPDQRSAAIAVDLRMMRSGLTRRLVSS